MYLTFLFHLEEKVINYFVSRILLESKTKEGNSPVSENKITFCRLS